MSEAGTFLIGTVAVKIENIVELPSTLSNLLRLPAPPESTGATTLTVNRVRATDWPHAVEERGGAHFFGRNAYCVEARPAERSLRLLIARSLNSDDLYWLQRDLFGLLCCLNHGLLLHAAALAREDEAYVFCGPSGVGKSTLTRMLMERGWTLINDELNWVYSQEQEVRIVHQPFWFSGGNRPEMGVKAVYLLEQHAQCGVLPPLARSESFARLLATFISVDGEAGLLQARAEHLLRLLEAIEIPVLQFNLNPAEIEAVLCSYRN